MAGKRVGCKFWLAHVALMVLGIAPAAYSQTSYPTRPIRFITPYAPGGSTTTMAHVLGQKLGESLGYNVIVDNRPGGNTIIGTSALAKSTPDGHTIMITTSIHVINPSLYANLPYDPIKDFAPVGTIYTSEFVLVASNSLPANTLQELLALAKAKPGTLNYATTGTGGSAHLASEMFNMLAGIRTQHVPYKGAGAVSTALIGGQVQLFFSNPLAVMPFLQNGRIKPIAITGDARLPALPNVPTFAESGLRGLDVKPWFCVLAPAGTPKPIVDKLSAEFARIIARSDIQDYMAKQGIMPWSSTPEQLAALMKTDLAKYAKLIKAANIKLEN